MSLFLAPTAYTETERFMPSVKSQYPKYAQLGARVIEVSIREMARFYDAPVIEWNDAINRNFSGSSSNKSQWVQRGFRSMTEAREFCRGFAIPKEIKDDAASLSRDLVRDLIQSGGNPRMLRHQMEGRFDVSSMTRVIRDLQMGRFSVEQTRPYKNRLRLAPSRPHVGICADGSWPVFWGDNTYIPRVMALSMGVAWACEAVDCPVTAAITRHYIPSNHGEYDLNVTRVIAPDLRVSTSDFAVCFHPELYRCGVMNAHSHTVGNVARRHNVSEEKAMTFKDSRAYSEQSATGGRGVAYLRECGATITVAIGKVDDRSDATITLEAKTPLRDAVKVIAETLAKQNRAMGVAA